MELTTFDQLYDCGVDQSHGSAFPLIPSLGEYCVAPEFRNFLASSLIVFGRSFNALSFGVTCRTGRNAHFHGL
eukprot:5029383-Pleurochrysis_carterae.AAC.1